jgi:hypothetical protein
MAMTMVRSHRGMPEYHGPAVDNIPILNLADKAWSLVIITPPFATTWEDILDGFSISVNLNTF